MKRIYYITVNHPQRGKGYYTLEAESLEDANIMAKIRFGAMPSLRAYPYREDIPAEYRTQLGQFAIPASESAYAK